MNPYRSFFAASLVLLAALYVIAHAQACTPADRVPEAGAAYAAQEMACVEKYKVRGDIDRCRAQVKAAWATVPDAGADAAADAAKDGS